MPSISFTGLSDALGAYYRDNGSFLQKQMFIELEAANRVPVISNVKDEHPIVIPAISDILQPGNPTAWNPTTDAFTFGVRTLKVRDWKVDLTIYPQQFHKQWTGRLTRPGSNPYLLDNTLESAIFAHVLGRTAENINTAFWRGVYNAAAVGAGAADPIRIINGVLQIITAELAQVTPKLTAVATGAITNLNAVASLEAMWQALDDRLKTNMARMYMAPSILEAYNLNYRNLHGDTAYNPAFGKRTLELSEGMCELVPIKALAGSGRVILDPADIIVMGTDLAEDADNIIVEQDKRALNIMLDGKIGAEAAAFEIGGIEYLVVNDQA